MKKESQAAFPLRGSLVMVIQYNGKEKNKEYGAGEKVL